MRFVNSKDASYVSQPHSEINTTIRRPQTFTNVPQKACFLDARPSQRAKLYLYSSRYNSTLKSRTVSDLDVKTHVKEISFPIAMASWLSRSY